MLKQYYVQFSIIVVLFGWIILTVAWVLIGELYRWIVSKLN